MTEGKTGDVVEALSPQHWVCEESLAESRQRYASMFTLHPHATYSLDRRGHFTDANRRALELTGLSLDELRHTHFARVTHPDDLHVVESGFAEALDGVPQVLEARVLRPDGTIVDFRTTMIPVVVGEEVVGVHGITEDVTEAKRVLRELEEANAAKTLFLGTVSHELRTPLAALVGATELLIGGEMGDDERHYVEMAHRSGQRLVQLVQDLLEFSCLEARRTTLRPRPFEVRALLAGIEEWAAPAAGCRGLSISFDVDDAVPATVVGDGMRVSQVVANLVHNALEFTERGAVDVRVRSRADDSSDAVWVEFEVADTGVGIAPDRVHALFEPFARADACPTRDHHGTGLGLAICRDLVDLMDGRLQASSEVGVGSTFTFGVPVVTVEEDGAA